MSAIREIQAKTLLTTVKNPADWFGVRYNMNIYRGCEHHCIYCDSRSECYQIENFDGEVLVKVNAVELLEKELSHKRIKGTVGSGSMSDPYTVAEKRYNLTGRSLEAIARYNFPAHLATKGTMVLKDLDTLQEINRQQRASVAFTITTTDDEVAAKLEPGAPRPSQRLQAMRKLAEAGILTGVLMMPILPFIEDQPENITRIVEKSAGNGAKFIIPWMGMSMRDRQRSYYYEKLDRLFPGFRSRYENLFGERYSCQSPSAKKLDQLFQETCAQYDLVTDMRLFTPLEQPQQLKLL